MDINYKELQGHVKALNEACGTDIKVLMVKKDDLIESFKEAINSGIENIPQDVLAYYNEAFGNGQSAADKQEPEAQDSPEEQEAEEPDGPEMTALCNTMESLQPIADALGVDASAAKSAQALEDKLIKTLADLSESEWDGLPVEIQQWDVKMAELATEAEKKAAEAKKAEAKKVKESQEAKKKKAKAEKKDPSEPRPDFRYSEGTNAFQIMEIFHKLSDKSESGGVPLKEIQDAAVKAKVKSSNVPSRVSVVLRYASTASGGSQCVKVGSLWYPKGKEPK